MSKKLLPVLAIAVVVVIGSIGFFRLSQSFVGNPKVVVEGNYIESAANSDSSMNLGGANENIITSFDAGIKTINVNEGGLMTVASGARHFTAQEICSSNIITLNGDGKASVQAQVMPTAATLISQCLPNKGDTHTVRWVNLSIDEVPSLAAGTTMDLYIASSSAGTTAELPANRAMSTTFANIEGTASISMFVSEFKHQ